MLALGRFWDGASDPLTGYASDRTRSAFGRRRPGCSQPRCPSASPSPRSGGVPSGLAPGAALLWIAAALLLFETARSAFQVPHLALAAALTRDERARNRVFGARLAATLAGYLLAALSLAALEASEDPRERVAAIALAAGLASAGLCALCAWRVHEPPDAACPVAASPWRAFGDVLRNRQARRLLGVQFLEAIGFGT